MRYLSEQQSRRQRSGINPLAVSAFKSVAVCGLVVVLAACGGGSDSGGGSTDSTGNTNGNGGAPAEGGAPSGNHPASGFYERTTSVQVSGGNDYSARLRIVIDPGGGVAVFENNALRAQARIVGNQFTATARGVSEALSGLSCTGDRSYTGSVAGTNARVTGSLSGNFTCDANRRIVLSSSFDLPRTGDHR